ncbi:CrpP family ICE-associated protein [Pseudomonas viridiflava]
MRKALRVNHLANLALYVECAYRHPAMRASWLKGFAQEQQQSFEF